MKYMLLIYTPDAPESAAGAESATGPRDMDKAWVDYDKAVADAGIRVSGDALHGPSTATTVRGPGQTTDGPFAETREVLGGYYVIDVPDLDAALDWAGRCPAMTLGGAVEVRPIVDFS
ncbi:MAG: YciI family protein [Pseudonocardia sp.]|nr:YciI family protein [Pseudonocardia sp.]